MALSPMVRGYLTAALWSSTDEDGEPLDASYDLTDFAPETVERATTDCIDFSAANTADVAAYCRHRTYDPSQGTVDDYLGHDLWLTRNGHGAGFWARGLGALGDRLTAAADAMGVCVCYVFADGRIYFE